MTNEPTLSKEAGKVRAIDLAGLREEIAEVQYWLTNSRMVGYELKAYAAAQTIHKHRAAFLTLLDRIDELEKALRPFARTRIWSHIDSDAPVTSGAEFGVSVTARAFRLARTTLGEKP